MVRNKEFSAVTVAMTSGNTASFNIPKWAVFAGIFIPAVADGDLTIGISTDDSTFHPLLDPSDGADLVVCASGADAGWVDISDYIRFISPDMYVRVSSAAGTATGNFEIRFSG